ncbi:hypothetical protein [Tateyamaria sp. Alg231-49]|uniref:hypothetical protein n=1 Tax=Tateyamaria sp. Alg231-49 TaxID=1922219 RepID=UPI000D550232|nr:hypothetical protein [Tateyamaria sp. Alg231-49]
MENKKQNLMPGVGDANKVEQGDLGFPRGSTSKSSLVAQPEMSPSKRRAAARTQKLSVSVNPDLYSTWNAIREDKEQAVVRAVELSLIAYLEQHGQTFKL